MKVFGLGLSRTGTTSLNKALNLLGIRSVHGPSDSVTQREIMDGKVKLSILEEYDAITDIPMALYYKDLDIVYPGSKFIITIRDVDDWLTSMQKHYEIRKLTPWNRFIRACAYGCIGFNRDRHRIAYSQHVENVTRYFEGRNDLLIMNVCSGDGWQNLCEFLKKPIPKLDFPCENKRSNDTSRIQFL